MSIPDNFVRYIGIGTAIAALGWSLFRIVSESRRATVLDARRKIDDDRRKADLDRINVDYSIRLRSALEQSDLEAAANAAYRISNERPVIDFGADAICLWSVLKPPAGIVQKVDWKLRTILDVLLVNVADVSVGRPIDRCNRRTGRILIEMADRLRLDVRPTETSSPLIRLIRLRSDRRTVYICMQMLLSIDSTMLDCTETKTNRTALQEACLLAETGGPGRSTTCRIIQDLLVFGFPYVSPDRWRRRPTEPRNVGRMLNTARYRIGQERNQIYKRLIGSSALIGTLLRLTLEYVL